jgi:hypothetical protein
MWTSQNSSTAIIYHAPQGGILGKGYRASACGRIERFGLDTIRLNVGIALCSPEDHFRRKVGRHKAIGRSFSNSEHRGIIEISKEDAQNRNFIKFLLKYLCQFAELYQHAKASHTSKYVSLENVRGYYLQTSQIE